MVSIMPGMDMAEPERTETSSGSSALPKPFLVFFSKALIWPWTSSHSPGGRSLVGEARYSRHAAVEITNPGGTLSPIWVISHRLAPLPPKQVLVLAVPFLECEHVFLAIGCHGSYVSSLVWIIGIGSGGLGAGINARCQRTPRDLRPLLSQRLVPQGHFRGE